MMKVLDMVRGVHSPMSVCGWLVPDDNTGGATASSVMPTTTGVLVDSDAATTGETPAIVEATAGSETEKSHYVCFHRNRNWCY